MSAGLEAPVLLHVELDRRINFALQQNAVPIIKALKIENKSGAALRDLTLRIVAEPNYSEPSETRIAQVAPGAVFEVGPIDLGLSPTFLSELTERIRGRLRIELVCDGSVIAQQLEAVDLLARDEWGGLSSLPESLAAFILPNHPEVEKVLARAAEVLRDWTGDASLSGYQSRDRGRVRLLAAAAYSAMQQLQLTYVNPPASFEEDGQRIRLPDRIVEAKMGTCLDLAALCAACLEQIGLHPLVVIIKGHAFVAVWTAEESFAEPVIDEPLRLRKRVDLDEILVFDPTTVTNQARVSFDDSVREGRRRLLDPESFLCAIDIFRARRGRIRPLPERVQKSSAAPGDTVPPSAGPAVAAVPQPPTQPKASTVPAAKPDSPQTPAGRIDHWQRKLLDLSLRNRLLNFRETKKTIPLLCPDLPVLEDALADGATYQILPRPRDLAGSDPRDPAVLRARTQEDAVAALLREDLGAKRLHAGLEPEELDRRLLELYRASRLELEEGGASALYLALGFLSWHETETSPEARLAPILLLPLELSRKSVRDSFTLRLSDEEPRINVTLLEMLKQDFGMSVPNLDALPEDDSGIDVPGVFRVFRETIRDVSRWDVVETAQIGLFSFAKFLMWRDLTQRVADLTKNAVVDHLVNRPGQNFDSGGAFPSVDRLDVDYSPLRTFCPLEADSSQLAAVFAAAEGRSFVLEGPPGTGKSQTITNVIAHCLSEGKTVLFVSEKMAALNVVHDRLRKVGLGRSCLELHSNKAHKGEVLKQLDDARQHAARRDNADWDRAARRLESLRGDLNGYVQLLHQPHSSGESVFQVTSRLIGLREVPIVPLRWESPDTFDGDRLADLRDLVDRVQTAAEVVGELGGNAWTAARCSDWTPGWQERLRAALAKFETAIDSLRAHTEPLGDLLALASSGWSLDTLEILRELASALVESPKPSSTILVRPDWDAIEPQLASWIAHGERRDALRAEVFERFEKSILALDLDDLYRRLAQAQASSWPASWFRRRRVRKALRSCTRDGKGPAQDQLGPALASARALREEEQAVSSAGDEARGLLGRIWKEGEADWKAVAALGTWAARLRTLARRVAGDDLQRAMALREKWSRLVTEGADLLARDASVGRQLDAYCKHYETFLQQRGELDRLLDLDVERAWGAPKDGDALPRARSTAERWIGSLNSLREWCAWSAARADAVASELGPWIEAHERGQFPSAELRRVFERSYAQWWHTEVVESAPTLARFFSPEHERKIEQFRQTDAEHLRLTRELVESRLSERVPQSMGQVPDSSEMGVLNREVRKKRRQLPVRRLLQAIPNLLPRLKPCLLMSPMSVAQYLDAGFKPFDLVVFDEASQIPVWDAIGAIARGKQAVIVGDPKQLPPTNFFQRVGSDDAGAEGDVATEDLESILDECLGAGIPHRSLDWHYRSRHESLIAFSNFHYYGNRLLTFPSVLREGIGLSWRHVSAGIYDKGKTRTNRAEADDIVAEIVRRLRDPELRKWSIGVVTFSEAQQTLVENLLEAVRRENPDIDSFFAEDRPEPVFVKNLENVQGDERDAILFSICFAGDATGRISMNFGPMNREGGERRLNVAITRARREVIVFSTLRADQIDLSRTKARGVADLKNFLEYAEKGLSAIAAASHHSGADFDSPFEEAVHDALVSKGWALHKQVGCSGYRIDLAVVDPDAPGRYLLGVECDGANYHRAKTARDRDKLRALVLGDLGWQLHRIWSTDWWTNPAREIERAEAAIASALRARRNPPAPPAAEIADVPQQKFASGPAVESPPLAAPAPVSTPVPDHEVYRVAPVARAARPSDEFYERGAVPHIRQLLIEVVAVEGPITLGLATRRVASHWGFERVREKAVGRVSNAIPKDSIQVTRSPRDVVLWRKDQAQESYEGFRVPGSSPDSARGAEDLPIDEIANAARYLLKQLVSVPGEQLAREMSRLFGFQRVGRVVEERMLAGIDRLVEKAWAQRDGVMIVATRQ